MTEQHDPCEPMFVERGDRRTAALLPVVGVREVDEVCVLEVAPRNLVSLVAVLRASKRFTPGGTAGLARVTVIS